MQLAHRSHRATRPGTSDRSEIGETLMEVLIAIILMGVGFTAILGGMFSSARIAQVNQRTTQASIYVQAVTEGILQPVRPISSTATEGKSSYVPCATAYNEDGSTVDTYKDYGYGPSAASRPGPGWGWRVVKVEYLDAFKSTSPEEPLTLKAFFHTSLFRCLDQGDNGLQRLQVEVYNTDGISSERHVVDRITILKRDTRCPATFDNADRGPC